MKLVIIEIFLTWFYFMITGRYSQCFWRSFCYITIAVSKVNAYGLVNRGSIPDGDSLT